MKTVDAALFQANLPQYLDEVQTETIVVTQNGKPFAVVHGITDDVESAELAHSPEFWNMIQARRKEPGIPWEEAKRQLF